MEISAVQIPSCAAVPRTSALPRLLRRPNSSLFFPSPARRRYKVSMCLESNETRNPGIKADTSDTSSHINSDPPIEDSSSSTDVEPATELKRAAKIHDFCFGIPFGGIVIGGGLVGYLFARNVSLLSTCILFGGIILALSTSSLKVWRQGKSSLPYIMGQSVLAAVLAANNFQTYSLTKKLFPSGFYAVLSAAMVCFYTYVLLAGGNPPSKKLKAASS